MLKKLVIIGAGGHGKVILETVLLLDEWAELLFVDLRFPDISEHMGIPVVAKSIEKLELNKDVDEAVVAIGDNKQRMSLVERLVTGGYKLPVISHPTSVISKSARIQCGTVIFANTIVGPDSNIGMGVIVNNSAIVEHDCIISDGTHVSPGVNIGGGTIVGKESWVCIGATVINNIKIGENAVIGAGSVVIENIRNNAIAVGVPAKEK